MSNPCTLHLPLKADFVGRDRSGAVGPSTKAGPERFLSGGRGYYAEEATTNLVPNPSFEVDTTGWVNRGSGVTIDRIATDASDGIACLQVTTPSGTNKDWGAATSPNLAVTAGQPYAFAFDMKGSPGSEWSLRISWRDGGGASLNISDASGVFAGAGWERKVVSGIAPANATQATLIAGTGATASTIKIDAGQFERKAYATSYTDTTRALTTLSYLAAGHISPARGAYMARFVRLTDTGNLQMVIRAGIASAGNDLLNIRVRSDDGLELLASANGANTNIFLNAAGMDVGSQVIGYCAWDGPDITLKKYVPATATYQVATGTRGAIVNNIPGGIFIGSTDAQSFHLDGGISDVTFFDRPLTDAEFDRAVAMPAWSFDMLNDAPSAPMLWPV